MPVGDGMTYTMLRIDGKQVAALYDQPKDQREMGAPPSWGSHVSVEDVDAGAARVKELGGSVLAGPFDVMEAGRMAVVQDPQCAVFFLWQPRESIGATLVNVPGAVTINQLNTSDPEAAGRFYSDLFGWKVERVTEDGAQPYWGIHNQGSLNGGMMNLPPGGEAPPHWLVYFATDDLDGAAQRIGELGGQVVVPPMAIPPSGRIAVARDPQGAYFALFEGRLDD